MGRDSTSVCHTCKVFQENGYGSYSTWMDSALTLSEFDAKALDRLAIAEYGKNQNVREFLLIHDGHEVERRSSDFDTDYKMSSAWGLEGYQEPELDVLYTYDKVDHKHHFGCSCSLDTRDK